MIIQVLLNEFLIIILINNIQGGAMRPGLFFLVVILIVSIIPLVLFAQKQTMKTDPDNIDIPYKKYVLDNGLTLLVHEDHKAPIVGVNVWYHVGSKNEKLAVQVSLIYLNISCLMEAKIIMMIILGNRADWRDGFKWHYE